MGEHLRKESHLLKMDASLKLSIKLPLAKICLLLFKLTNFASELGYSW